MFKIGRKKVKMDPKTIEDNLRKLIQRLKLNVTPVNKYVAVQLKRAISIYSHITSESKKAAISQSKRDTISIFIEQASHQLEQLSTFEKYSSEDVPYERNWQKQLEVTMFCINQIEEKFRKKRIDEYEYEDYLTLITTASQQLDNSSELVEDDKLAQTKDKISVLFLELFIRTPVFSISNQKYLEQKHLQPVSTEQYNMVKEELEKKLYIEKAKDQDQQNDNGLKSGPPIPAKRKIASYKTDSTNVTKEERNKKPSGYSVLIKDRLVDELKSKPPLPLKRKIASNNTDIANITKEEKATIVFDDSYKTAENLEMLETATKENERRKTYLQALQNIERQVDFFKGLKDPQRRTKLNECNSMLVSLSVPDDDTCAKREEIIKKIQKLQTEPKEKPLVDQKCKTSDCQEPESYFDKIKASLNKYKIEVEEFTYPLSSKRYQRKRDEIAGLLENYEGVLLESVTTKGERGTLSCEIHKILKTLQEKASQNEEINRSMGELELAENELLDVCKSNLESSEKLLVLGRCKKKVECIEELNDEILIEKRDLLMRIETVRAQEMEELMKYACINVSDLKKFSYR